MFHSGARYAVKDIKLATLCSAENKILNKLFSFALEDKDGFFTIQKGDSKEYIQKFIEGCKIAKIEIEKINRKSALTLEKNLGPQIEGAFITPDKVIDTHLLVQHFREELSVLGVKILENYEVVSAKKTNNTWHITTQSENKKETELEGNIVVNTTGAWVGDVAKLFGSTLNLTYIHGSMITFEDRLINRVITLCAPNVTGDVIIPYCNETAAGSTWHELDHNNPIKASQEDTQNVIATAKQMIPKLTVGNIKRTFTGIRTHMATIDSKHQKGSKFDIPRNYTIINHGQRDGLSGLYTALSGKLVLGRLVAEHLFDEISEDFGIKEICNTKEVPFKRNINFHA